MRLTWQMLFHAKPKLRIRAHAQAHPKDHVGFRHSTAPFPDVFIDLAVLADPQTLGAFDSIMDSLKTAFFFFFFFFFPLLIPMELPMESMMNQIQQRLKSSLKKDMYRLAVAP